MKMSHLSENHEPLKGTNELIEKLTIAAQRAVIQLKAASKAMNDISLIAKSLGYKIDNSDGSLIKKDN